MTFCFLVWQEQNEIAMAQKLNDGDVILRITYLMSEITIQLADEENLLQVLIMSDELRSVFHFELLGKVNKQNCWYWSAENSKEIHELHANKKAFWCGVAHSFGSSGCTFLKTMGEGLSLNSIF